jgi:hypothetical protein
MKAPLLTRICLALADRILRLDVESRGLVEVFAPGAVRWSVDALREPDDASRTSAPPAPDLTELYARIAALLGARAVCIFGPADGIYEIHVGARRTPAHRPITEEEWERLILAGVPLMPWSSALRLRIAIECEAGGTA